MIRPGSSLLLTKGFHASSATPLWHGVVSRNPQALLPSYLLLVVVGLPEKADLLRVYPTFVGAMAESYKVAASYR